MSYDKHFKHADDVIAHLNIITPLITDDLLKAKYVGFVAVVAVTVYELAIKEVFIEFGSKKHNVFGTFTEAHFYRLNGRIKLADIKGEHIKKFGERYKNRFEKKLKIISKDFVQTEKRDLQSSYSNLIQWRHDFAHKGKINANATYEDAVTAYEDGKKIIQCLAETMRY